MDFTPIWLSFKLALITASLLLIIAGIIAYFLHHSKSRLRPVVESFLSLPVILPPTVLGFYLLLAFSPEHLLGRWFQDLGIQMVFTFEGLVLASMVYNLPFMLQPISAGLRNLPESIEEAAYTMGKGRRYTYLRVLLPNIKPSIISGVILTIAHTIGEFGVVLMIGGSIPGETRLASLEVWEKVESLDYAGAHTYSAILFGLAFIVILATHALNHRWNKHLSP